MCLDTSMFVGIVIFLLVSAAAVVGAAYLAVHILARVCRWLSEGRRRAFN